MHTPAVTILGEREREWGWLSGQELPHFHSRSEFTLHFLKQILIQTEKEKKQEKKKTLCEKRKVNVQCRQFPYAHPGSHKENN